MFHDVFNEGMAIGGGRCSAGRVGGSVGFDSVWCVFQSWNLVAALGMRKGSRAVNSVEVPSGIAIEATLNSSNPFLRVKANLLNKE